MSPVKVPDPTTIHGSRQTGIAARTWRPGGGSAHTRSAAASQPGSGQPRASLNILRSDASSSSSVLITVTQTGIPAARRRSTSTRRFSSLLASTMPGDSRAMAARSGFFVPRTRGPSSSAGWVHQSVAPASASGRVTATDSVSDGTSDTTRPAGRSEETGWPRSSWSDIATVLAADLEERLGDLLEAAYPGGVHQDGEHVV